MGVFGIRGGSDEGAAVVGLGEAGRGVEIAQVLRAWKGAGVKGVVCGPCGFSQGEGGGGGRIEADLSAALFA